MHASLRLPTAALLAAFAVALAAGSAPANRSLSISGETRLTLTGTVTFLYETLSEVVCNATIVKTLSRSWPKTAEVQIGKVTSFTTSGCTGTVLLTFRRITLLGLERSTLWVLRYQAFLGSLPNITSVQIRIEHARLLLEASSLAGTRSCLFEGSVEVLEVVEREVIRALRTIAGASEPTLRATLAGTCPSRVTIRAEFTPSQTTLLSLIDSIAAPWVVSVGDSYIAGDGGRWAGNTLSRTVDNDALDESAYADELEHVEEIIPGCHRSLSAEIYLGEVNGNNLGCTGARTRSTGTGEEFIPGLDFAVEGSLKGQAKLLQEFAERHRDIKLVAISIGANDFDVSTIAETCIFEYSTREGECVTDPSVTGLVEAAQVTRNEREIAEAIVRVRRAMREAGIADAEYVIAIQNYSSPVPPSRDVRYAERTTRRDEVCPFYNADFDWISETAIVRINEAVTGGFESARTRIGAAPRLIRIDLERAFGSHRLCDRTVGLLEEKRFSRWDAAGAVNEVEWITRYQTLEPFHPNYWAQLALRNCLRRAFNGGLPTEPREGRCRIRAAGLTALGEPDMEL